MNNDFTNILASKQAFRHALATCDITEKLNILDSLRERAVLLRCGSSTSVSVQTVAENPPEYSVDSSRK